MSNYDSLAYSIMENIKTHRYISWWKWKNRWKNEM